MKTQTTVDERKLIGIVRRLPPARVSQVIDFAQFLEWQMASDHQEEESEAAIAAENARWDALLATEESQRLLEQMADEALAEIQAGRARPMLFTANGELTPG